MSKETQVIEAIVDRMIEMSTGTTEANDLLYDYSEGDTAQAEQIKKINSEALERIGGDRFAALESGAIRYNVMVKLLSLIYELDEKERNELIEALGMLRENELRMHNK